MNEDLLDEFGDPINDPTTVTDTTPNTTTSDTPIVADEFFLKTGTGTVYKTSEEAIRGTEQKDTLIQRLRDEAIARTGVDPVTGKPVTRHEATVDYTQDGERFLTDLATAAKTGDAKGYARVQQQLVEDVLKPYAPILTGFAKTQAVSNVSREITGFNDFIGSADYSATLNDNPALKQAIEYAEATPSMANGLGEYYKMAFKLNVSRKLPEGARGPQTSTQARPTVSSNVHNPPQTSSGQVVTPSLETSEGRKALIEKYERGGIGDFRF